ncbi:Arc family DNA-binding protein [Stutzerimonas nitrititolerans]|uniref:Arc family DNA-binding protein n=1 Tax=Stutzerimonas nitrititolerans TaxID=2482751 RepID=UPI0028AC33A8|nr:Arc family DNA-binding protein [Stutzerimonas nitrititolerans]
MERTEPQFKLRLPQHLKADLEHAAQKGHRSLSAEIIARLEKSFGRAPGSEASSWAAAEIFERVIDRDLRFIDTLELGKIGNVVRLRPRMSTHEAVDQLLVCLATLENITSVTLAVRDGYANYSALSVVFHTEETTLVADSTPLTVERPPRESEVRDLIWALDIRGLLGGATRFRTQRIPQTSDLPEQQAAEAIEGGELTPLGYKTLPEFLALFHEKPVSYSREELDRFFAD